VPSQSVIDDAALVAAAARHHHLLTPNDLRRLGVSTHRWNRLQDRGLWIQVTPAHFRHSATPLTIEMQIRAASEWLGERGALFGMCALWWLGVDIPTPPHAEFLVGRAERSVANWMTIHTSRYWNPSDAVRHAGVRTTTAARALVDFASTAPPVRDVENAIDNTLRARRTALPKIREELHRVSHPGRRGLVMMRELLLDSGGESPLERRFLRLVRQSGLRRPETQVVFRKGTTFVARVDFLFGRVVVEVSGRLGHVSDRERQQDARRRNELQRMGLMVIEFTTADVIADPAHVVTTLRSLPDVTA
jgi:very-short-patch-repair endonuclease